MVRKFSTSWALSRAMQAPLHRLQSLPSPAFIVALILLVANDFALKPLFHNALTGKLSDFAGLFALTLFAATLWPRHRLLASWAIAAAFTFWKTSYAEPLIEALNDVSPLTFGRTVDLTDLMALPMIPVAVWAAPRLPTWRWPRLLQLGLVALALVAFTATSRARYVARDTMDVTQASAVDEAAFQAAFDEITDERGLRCSVCVRLSVGRVYVPEGDSDVRALIAKLDARRTLLFTVSGYDRRRGVRSLARHVRGELEDRFPDVAIIDTTTDLQTVVEGDTTVFVVRAPRGRAPEDVTRTMSSIVAELAQAHGLETNAESPARAQGLSVTALFDRTDMLLVQVIQRYSNLEALRRAVTQDLGTRLDAAFGAENVTVHHVPANPPEWVF